MNGIAVIIVEYENLVITAAGADGELTGLVGEDSAFVDNDGGIAVVGALAFVERRREGIGERVDVAGVRLVWRRRFFIFAG